MYQNRSSSTNPMVMFNTDLGFSLLAAASPEASARMASKARHESWEFMQRLTWRAWKDDKRRGK